MTRRGLIGKLAQVRYTVTEHQGRAWLYDPRGVMHEVACRVNPGDSSIAPGNRVLIYDYDEAAGVYLVCPDPTATQELQRTSSS